MGHYKSNVRDLDFNLFEVLNLEKALATGEFGDLDGESVRQMLEEASRLAEGPLAESFADADRNPPTFDPATHTVSLPEPFKKSFRAWHQGEWFRIGMPEDSRRGARAGDVGMGHQRVRAGCPAGGVHVPVRHENGRHPLQHRQRARTALGRADDRTRLGRHHGAHRTRCRIGRRRGSHQGGPPARRHLAPRRCQTVHHQRRHRRPVREHPACRVGPARGRRPGHQGTESVPGAEIPLRSRDRKTR